MQNYTATVRLRGSAMNEVQKEDVTAAEVIMLKRIHGEDALVNIRPTRMDKRNHKEERARLSEVYGARKVEELFGNEIIGAKLPVKLDGIADIPSDTDDDLDDESEETEPEETKE